jgi:flagellar motor switch protein FliN
MAEEPAPAAASDPLDPNSPAASPAPDPAATPVEASAAAPLPDAPLAAAPAPADAVADAAAVDAGTADASAYGPPITDPASADAAGAPDPADAMAAAGSADALEDGGVIDQATIDELLKQANFEDPTAVQEEAAVAPRLPDTSNFELPNFQQVMADAQVSSIDLLRDVELNVKIELGRSRMLVEDVLKLGEGSVVELDKLAGDPVDVFVNDRLVARGEVLVLNDNFCVRVNEILAGAKEEF